MSNIKLINPENTTGEHKELFDEINGAFGTVINMFKAIGNSHVALESMWTSFVALGKGKLDQKLVEKIAVYVADINNCKYCLAAHTALGKKAGASAEEMFDAQIGHSEDPKTQAALAFAYKLVVNHGHIAKEDFDIVNQAGFSDEETTEIFAHVLLNIFTNYTNVAFDVPLDFPSVKLRNAA